MPNIGDRVAFVHDSSDKRRFIVNINSDSLFTIRTLNEADVICDARFFRLHISVPVFLSLQRP